MDMDQKGALIWQEEATTDAILEIHRGKTTASRAQLEAKQCYSR